MKGGSGHGGGGGGTFTFDDPVVLLSIFVFIYGGCWAAWHFAHTQISMVYTYIRYAQLWVFYALGSIQKLPGVSSIRDWVQTACEPTALLGRCARDFSEVQWNEIVDSSISMNIVSLVVVTLLCIRIFLRVNKTHPGLNFSKTHNIASFVRENRALYPHLRMFSQIDLIAQPLDHPVFGMSLTSRQFAYKHRLINGWKDLEDGSWSPSLDREAATRIFRLQLGKLWTKSTELSVSETMLLAIAIPRVVATDATLPDDQFKRAIDDSDAVINWCWDQFKAPENTTSKSKGAKNEPDYAWLTPQIDLTMPREIIAKYIKHANVQAILEKHAFNRTVLVAMLLQARRLGVLQPAEMRWMRFFDRGLWYVLQTAGRQAAFPEAAAVLSHYLYEIKSASALVEPQVDKAVSGLDVAMTTFRFLTKDKNLYESAGTQIAATQSP